MPSIFALSLYLLVCCSTSQGFTAFTSGTTKVSFATVNSKLNNRQQTTILEEEETIVVSPNNIKKVQRTYSNYSWKDYNINYRVEGSPNNPPILLIHGFGANVNHFRYQFPDLVDAGYRVYAIDLLGFGASDKPPDAPYSIELFTDICSDFIKEMSSSSSSSNGNKLPWVVAGNSIGGLCALATAEQILDCEEEIPSADIKACVLFNCAGGMSGFRYEDVPIYIQPILWFVQNIVLGPQLGGYFFENFRTRENVEQILNTQGVYRDTTNVDDELLEILLEPGADKGAKEVFLATFGGPPGPTPESILPKLADIPILALWGGADPWTPVDRGMHPGNQLENFHGQKFELSVIENTGHCPHDECPTEVNQRMISWLKGL